MLLAYDFALYIARILNVYKYSRWFVKGLLNLKVNKEEEEQSQSCKQQVFDDAKVRFTTGSVHKEQQTRVIYDNVVSH